ncbi:hypothetical protein PoB_003668200 [Plakobranchus ocellatus]|uniref:Uncharacterized protein n=1 Tax=Plakobranchus ocellatus TaxID=259542 RepID=A0AAV4AS86_9GAST|nr:hypothetical protein PoB_003668200 [Plakobranchus ocellatus]
MRLFTRQRRPFIFMISRKLRLISTRKLELLTSFPGTVAASSDGRRQGLVRQTLSWYHIWQLWRHRTQVVPVLLNHGLALAPLSDFQTKHLRVRTCPQVVLGAPAAASVSGARGERGEGSRTSHWGHQNLGFPKRLVAGLDILLSDYVGVGVGAIEKVKWNQTRSV